MKALLDIPEDVNQTLNIVKAQNKLKNKVEAITLVVNIYKKEHMEPELRPEFVQRILHAEKKGKFKTFKHIDEVRRHIEHA